MQRLSLLYYFSIITAFPKAPFPNIVECTNQTHGQSCNVTSSHHLSITCTVRDYYPSINVYFWHKSNIWKSLTSAEWNNTDWTMNKNVTIMAVPSDDPYICVASGIPGYDERELTASIFVNAPLPESTTGGPNARATTQAGAAQRERVVSE